MFLNVGMVKYAHRTHDCIYQYEKIQKHVTMCTLKNNLLIQIPVKGLIVSPLHAQWLLVMQEWVLHQVVQLCIQDCLKVEVE